MIKKIVTFDNTEIEKHKFHYSKYLIKINNVDIDKIILRFLWAKRVLNLNT